MIRLALVLLGGLAMVHAAAAGPLDTLRWSKRVLLVFAEDSLSADQQLSAFPSSALAERDMVVLAVPLRGKVRVAAGKLDDIPSPTALRRHFKVEDETPFVAVLVGKDGGVKARETRPITAEALFGLIDSMPMRRQEMRTGQP